MHSEDRITHTAPSTSPVVDTPNRSEEHTSELQSRLHLVCRLLLEKKKKNNHVRLSKVDDRIDVGIRRVYMNDLNAITVEDVAEIHRLLKERIGWPRSARCWRRLAD